MISLIRAKDKNWLIGDKNKLPWKLPADMKRFRELTNGKPIIMGRKTFESIGKPLPNRTNIIITSDKNYRQEDCIVAHSVEAAIDAGGHDDEIMVIGGSNVYKQFLSKADRLYITIIDHAFEGDTHFPKFDMLSWEKTEEIEHLADDKNPYPYTFLTLERKRFIK